MELHSEKTLTFARNALNRHARILASESDVKKSAAILTLSNAIGVDRKSLKDFVEGTVAKPTKASMQKYVTWLGNNPEPRDFDPRDVERGNRMPTKDELRQKIKRLVDELDYAQSYIQELQEKRDELVAKIKMQETQDPEFADKYQVAHPDHLYWMQNSQAYIEVLTGDPFSDDPYKRVCTLPVPYINLSPRIWDETLSDEHNVLRDSQASTQQMLEVFNMAEKISYFYSEICDWPGEDGEIIVNVRFHNI